MDKIFNPRSVAVVGVSDNPQNMARMILLNLANWKFKGRVYGVHPRGGEALGVKIFPSLSDIKGAVDLAVVLSPASTVPGILDDARAKGVKHMCIETAGFSEYSEEGARLGELIVRKANEYGITFVGPNGLGTLNSRNGAVFPFSYIEPFKPGVVSVISQSGGVGITILNGLLEHNLSANKFVSLGNKYSLDETDFLEYFIEDKTTEIILCYLESIERGERFARAAARSRKPILLLKAGATGAGTRQAMSHTGALVNDDAALSAVLRQAGVVRVKRLESLCEYARAFLQPRIKGSGIALASPAGGLAVIASDCAEKNGFNFPALSTATEKAITEKLRAGVIQVGNPIDLGDALGTDTLLLSMEKVLAQEDVSGFVLASTRRPAHQYKGPFQAMKNPVPEMETLVRKLGKPAVAAFIAAPEVIKECRGDSSLPVYDSVDSALEALAAYRDYCALPERRMTELKTRPSPTARRIVKSFGGGFVSAAEAFPLLEASGIAVCPFAMAGSARGAAEAAEKMGLPVAIKADSPDVVHKTEMNAVRLGLNSAGEARAAYKDLSGMLRKNGFSGGVMVQKMAEKGVEAIVGIKRDPHFGPVVMFGLGGVFVEILKDVAMRPAPLSKRDAMAMIEEVKAAELLKGARGAARADIAALADAIVRAGNLAAAFPEIAEMDINPLIVLEKGKGCVAVDARIRIDRNVEKVDII